MATISDTRGDLDRYTAGRETLGRTCTLPEDVDSAADTLAEMFGGPRRAAAWLRRVLRQLDGRTS